MRSIQLQINQDNLKLTKDLELINLILNLDIWIKTLEDLEEQIVFSKSNHLNRNILSLEDREYIWKFLENQQINIKFEDEIYQFVQSIASLQNNHIIIIIKIPIIEQKQYRLIQLEPINTNGTRIDTNIRYVAQHQHTFYEQKERCENSYPVNDECVFNILTNQKARCSTYNQPDQPIIKEITLGTILIDTAKSVHVEDSCGDSRIIATPTIVGTDNCTVTVQNFTFKSNPRPSEQHEFLTPIFGKEIIITKQRTDIEDLHQMNLNNLEEINSLKFHMTSSLTLGGIVIASLVSLPLIIFCIRRYKSQYRSQPHVAKEKDTVTLRISRSNSGSSDEYPKEKLSNQQKEKQSSSATSFFPAKFTFIDGSAKSTEDV